MYGRAGSGRLLRATSCRAQSVLGQEAVHTQVAAVATHAFVLLMWLARVALVDVLPDLVFCCFVDILQTCMPFVFCLE